MKSFLPYFGYLLLWYWLLMAEAKGQFSSDSALANRSIFSTGIGLQYGFIFAHSPAVENTAGSHPRGVEILIGWQKNNRKVWDLCNCFPRKGLLLAYYDYDSRILGKSITAAYFLEPTYRLSNTVFFSFRGVAGFSYLTNPFDSIKNPENASYSTHLSGYLLLGLGLWLRMNDHWWLNVSANYQHESNGGLKEPNKGINWPTAGMALSYNWNPTPYYRGMRTKEKFWKDYSPRYDIAIFGMPKRIRDENGESKRLPLIGLSVQGAKQVGRINALTVGLEVFADKALEKQLKMDEVDASHVRAGILAGHEFLLGKFIFSQRLGVYIYDQTDYYDQFYHRWGIYYKSNKNFGIGLNLQAHKQVAEYIDLRIGYSFQKKGPAR